MSKKTKNGKKNWSRLRLEYCLCSWNNIASVSDVFSVFKETYHRVGNPLIKSEKMKLKKKTKKTKKW